MKRAGKGDGRVYQPKYVKDGKAVLGRWRIRYTCGRKVYDEKLPDGWQNTKTAAREFLKQKWTEIRAGQFVAGANKLRYTDLRDGLLRYYEVNGMKTLLTARDGKTRYISGQSHLDNFFEANPRSTDITTTNVEEFKKQRLKDGASNANINLSLGLLRQMFNVAIDEGKIALAHAPRVKLLDAPDARDGFLEPDDFVRLHAALDDDLKPAAMLGYDTGMRLGEIANLRWSSVDLDAGEIRLSPEETKTDEARTIPLGRMLAVVEIMRLKAPQAEYVFGGSEPLGDFRKRWYAACVLAGVGRYLCAECGTPIAEDKCQACSSTERKYQGITFHDLRRSAVRNMIRSGISETVAMKISGHRTRSVFDRYNITSTRDLHEAAKRRDRYVIEESQRKLEPSEGKKRSEENLPVF
jgi:integrase